MNRPNIHFFGEKLLNNPNSIFHEYRAATKRDILALKILELAKYWACILSREEKEQYREKFESKVWPYCINYARKSNESRRPYLSACLIEIAYSLNFPVSLEALEAPLVQEYRKNMENTTKVFTLITHDIPRLVHGFFAHKYYQNIQEEICCKIVKEYLSKRFHLEN